jgi:uncharacterized paraquat-inducible protein A
MFEEIADVNTVRVYSEVDRREFLDRLIRSGVVSAIALLVPSTTIANVLPMAPPKQANWRQCKACLTMFYNGFRNKGRCPKGGTHFKNADDLDFKLIYNSPESPHRQTNWRYCSKCQALFFDGLKKKGVCAAGGVHSAQGFIFTLPHDANVPGRRGWRFCQKCNGGDDKGVCASGGAHSAQGFNFILDDTVRID